MKWISFFVLFTLGITVFGQQTESVDFISIEAEIGFKPYQEEVHLSVKYKFKILKDVDSVYLNASNVYHFEIHDKSFKSEEIYKNNLLIFKNPIEGFKADTSYEFTLIWFAYPKKALYFIDWNNEKIESLSKIDNQIWTQGQGKYTSNWLPSIDDMNDKIEFDLTINFDKNYEVIANGELVNVAENDTSKTWQFNMNKPMSSYLVAFAIGKYDKKIETATSGIPLEYYYYPKDSLKVEPTYRYTKQMFDFLEDEIGVPLRKELQPFLTAECEPFAKQPTRSNRHF